jgi:hypothetical protein
MKTILKAVRVPDFDMVGDEHYGDRPYGVVLDVYDTNDNFIENGTDWSYFANETEAEDYCRVFNAMNGDTIDVEVLAVNSSNYKTDKGYINKNYCYCNPATTSVGDIIKVRTKFLQNYNIKEL